MTAYVQTQLLQKLSTLLAKRKAGARTIDDEAQKLEELRAAVEEAAEEDVSMSTVRLLWNKLQEQ